MVSSSSSSDSFHSSKLVIALSMSNGEIGLNDVEKMFSASLTKRVTKCTAYITPISNAFARRIEYQHCYLVLSLEDYTCIRTEAA